MKYVVDTSVFNKLLDGLIRPDELPSGQFIATHVQIDELKKTKDEARRKALVLTFEEVVDRIDPTESFLFNLTPFGAGKLSDGRTFASLKKRLDALNEGKANNIHDALIAEVAIVNNATLLTADYDLQRVTQELGGDVRYWRT